MHGFGETAGAPLSAHPDVDLICFTGETATGRLIIAAGAPTLKRSSIELGGKSPVVVFEDADPERAVDAALAQIFTMNGQRCTAGSRLLVQRPLYERIVTKIADRARNVRVGDPFDPRTELGPLISPSTTSASSTTSSRPAIRARTWSRAASGHGGPRAGQLPRGDGHRRRRRDDEGLPRGDLRAGAQRCHSTDEEDAIRLANATPYGLAAYVWTNDIRRAHRVAQAIDTGMCWINSQNVRDLRTPFGGVKHSGIGREGGDYAFDFYCETEIVHVGLAPIPSRKLSFEDADSS